MAKSSRQRPVRYEKDRAGCIWGFISIFDFRHGRSARKLLSDRGRPNKQVVGVGFSKLQMLINSNVISQEIYDGVERDSTTADAAKTSVKELMEEEMFSEQDQKKQVSSTNQEPKESDSEHRGRAKKNRMRTSKSSKTSCAMHFELDNAENLVLENSCHQDPEGKSSKQLDLEVVMNELCQQIYHKSTNCMNHGRKNDLDMQSKEKYSAFDEKLIEAIKLFVDQKLTDGKDLTEDRRIEESEEFIKALQTSSSNKELVLELLKDPKSLLVKNIEDLEDAHLEKDRNSNLLDRELNKSKRSMSVAPKQLNFFRRRNKSQENFLLKEKDEDCPTSNRIIILKPAPADVQVSDTERNLSSSLRSHCDLGTKEQTRRIASQFSFTEIKRKLKHAMGKERHEFPSDDIAYRFPYKRKNEHHKPGNSEKGIRREKSGWNSPNRNHFYNESFAKPAFGIKNKDKNCKPKDTEASMGNETVAHSEQRVTNIYIEAKKHLSEILGTEDEIKDFSRGQLPKTLGRILSLPEFNFSPVCSPQRDKEHSFQLVNEDTWQLMQENHVSHLSQNLNSESCISDNPEDKVQSCNSNPDVSDELNHANTVEGAFCSMRLDKSSEVDVVIEQKTDALVQQECQIKTGVVDVAMEQKTDALVQQESQIMEISAEDCSSPVIRNDQNSDLAEVCDEDESSQCLKLESFEQDQLLNSTLTSPPSSSITKNIGELERTERPSPISVLEPLFLEDDISPASIKFQPVEPLMPPLRIHFEEQVSSATNEEISDRACMEDEESAFEYVEIVLLASDLNWEEFLFRWLSSDQILDPSLFDEVELFSNRSRHDQKLLFDCTNEILEEVCERYFGYSPWVSFVKHNIRPIPRGKELICEVWEGVEWHLLPQLFPRTLDHILRKDMAKPGTWMDLRIYVESVGSEIGEAIFEELVEDTISSFVNEGRESDPSGIPEELIETE